ncbi:6,7-dimethyl-8-ribityllumazine synthase [Dirofilaria immitis]
MKRAVVFVVIIVLIFCQIKRESFGFIWSEKKEDHLQKCDFETFLKQQRSHYREFKDLLPWFKSEMSWTTMVRQYLSDCFPADEKGNDPTVTADLSELSFPDYYETSMPLGFFRINQAIQKFSIPMKDNDIIMPNYINLHKEMLADEQQRAGYTIHKRLYFRNLVHLGEDCENEKAPFIFGNQRIISLMHERNMPYEVPCFTCLKKLPSANIVNTFYMLPRRDVFAPIPFRDRIEAFSAYEFDIAKEDREDEKREDMEDMPTTTFASTSTDSASFRNDTDWMQNAAKYSTMKSTKIDKIIQAKQKLTKRQYHRIPFASFLYNFATKKFTDPNYEDKRTTFRGPFLADRWWDRMVVTDSELEVAVPVPDGRLRINPDPGRLRQYYPHFNSMTIVCAEQVDGTLIETDVIVNVDTLIEEPIDEKPECLFSLHFSEEQKQKCTTKYHSFRERREDDYGKFDYRYRIRDYQPVPTHFHAILKKEYNLKIDIGYERWSCCTACCCTKKVCRREFALDREECKKLESYRSRLAYMSFFKIDPLKKVTLSLNVSGDSNYMEEVIMTFDKYLSSDPYFTTGIPIHSTLLITDAYWRKLRQHLIDQMLGKKYAIQKIKGRLGLFVESENCDESEQKLDCEILEKCRQDFQKMRVFSAKMRPMKITEELLKRKFEECGTELISEQINMNDLENFGILKRGYNYLISINETFFGAVTKVSWKFGSYQIPNYNYQLPCSLQRVATAPNKKDLLIIGARKDDTAWPYIGKATMLEDGSDAYFKIILKFVSPEMDDPTTITWTIIVIVVFTILSATLIIVYVIQFHYKRKTFKKSFHKETPV